MTLLTTSAAEANFPSSARVLHVSPSLPDLYSSTHHTHRLRRSSPPMNTAAALSSVDLQQHIYNSLLESRTADVSLHVYGTWEAIYKLHRVILIQSVRKALVSRPPTKLLTRLLAGVLQLAIHSGLPRVLTQTT